MKKIIITIVLFFGIFVSAQNYVPDPSFATNGFIVTNYNMYYDNNQAPSNCFYINNKYIFTQKTQMSAFNYDGSIDFTFGTLGYSRLSDPTLVYNIFSSKVIDNYIYLMGVKTNNSSIRIGFVAKMNIDGILDNSFGVNGVSSFSIGTTASTGSTTNEKSGVYDLVIKDGYIFVVGTTYYSTTTDWNRMFVSKLTLNGIVDTTFDTNGYKIYPYSQDGMGKGVFSYEDDLLLVADGKNYAFGVPLYQTSKVLIKIDENGNYVNSFGTNGKKIIDVCTGCGGSSERIYKVTLKDNYLYMLTVHHEASPFDWNVIEKVNISTLQTTSIASSDSNGNYLIDNDKIYVLGCDNSPSATATCPYDFNLARRNLDGTLDITFNQSGLYNFNFNSSSTSIDRATVLIKHTDGKIMMAGYTVNGSATTAPNRGFAIARIADVLLSNTYYNSQNNFSVAPNPVQNILNIVNMKNRTIKKVIISDVSGKIVYESNSNDSIINIEQFIDGIYIIRINSEDKTEFLKFIKN